jgi:hypothetical protein
MEIKLNIWEFKRKFDENYSYMLNGGNQISGFSELVDEFEYIFDRSASFRNFVDSFVDIRRDIICTSNEMAAFILTMYDLMPDRKSEEENVCIL